MEKYINPSADQQVAAAATVTLNKHITSGIMVWLASMYSNVFFNVPP